MLNDTHVTFGKSDKLYMVQVLNATNVTGFKCYKCYKFPIVSNATHVTNVSNAEISTHTQLHESCPLLHVYQEHFAV